jgi:hypothetical protein
MELAHRMSQQDRVETLFACDGELRPAHHRTTVVTIQGSSAEPLATRRCDLDAQCPGCSPC